MLTAAVSAQLRELAARARHRETGAHRVADAAAAAAAGIGVTALFAGDSGTGKTMSAEVIAGELGLDLYTVNLATVVDKYVGETEKNLERIFTEAGGRQRACCSSTRPTRSSASAARCATPTTATPTSRAPTCCSGMETFDGLAILATNLRANIDEAFTRRLDAIIDFPTPTAELRPRAVATLPRAAAAASATTSTSTSCADAFELPGGNIRSAATTAAYLAAAADRPVGDGGADRRRRAGVPQARPAGAGARVRASGADWSE